MKNFSKLLIFLLFSAYLGTVQAQLTVSTAQTPAQLVQNVLVGTGVTVSNVTYSGINGSIGHFTTGPNPTNLGISSGIVISTGLVNGSPPIGSPVGGFASNTNGTGSDPQLAALIPGYTVNDAAVLQFNFIPLSDTIKFRYVFASEEYPEWVGSSFNDVFGFFVTGPNPLGGNYNFRNIATIPGTTLPVTIDNVNHGSYSQYYVNNEAMGGQTIVYDGFTVVLTAWCLVVPCVQYHIKIAIGDAGDSAYDSAVFLEANSFSTNAVTIQTFYTVPLAGTDAIEGCNDAVISFQLPNPLSTPFNIPYQILGTAINGVDYVTIPNSITIPAGQDSANLIISPILDSIPEGTETVILVVQTTVCGGMDTIVVNILDYTLMSITTSPDTTICGGSATIWANVSDGLPPHYYTWSNGAGNVTSQVVSPTATTTYGITVNDVCGHSVIDNITIHWGQGSADAGADTSICEGEFVTLIATGGTGGYLWSNGVTTAMNPVSPGSTTTYYVTAYGACDAFDSVTVTVHPAPVVVASASLTNIFYGDAVTLTGTGAATYTWCANPPDPSLAGQTNSPNPVVMPSVTTTYSVVGQSANHCTGTDIVTVYVDPVFPDVYFVALPVSGCQPLVVQFLDSSSRVSPGALYRWDFGNGTYSNMVNPQAYYPDFGTYDVSLTITNTGGFAATYTAYGLIEVYPNPIAFFQPLPGYVVSEYESNVGFFDQSAGNPVAWNWWFGDGDSSFKQNVFHQYQDTGRYDVTFVATTEHGCTDTARAVIYVRPEYEIYIPNAFTPNADGRNDEFRVFARGILEETFEMRIFTRWGQQIFYSNDLYKGWDGVVNGNKVSLNTFVYDVRFTDRLYREHRLNGIITVVH